METMKLSSDEISKLPNLGGGACATVYKYSDELAVKVFKKQWMELHNEESFSEIFGIENETCVFPKCRIEIDGTFQGYAMQYIDGSMLDQVVKEIDLKTLTEAIRKAESDLKLLSADKIMFNDVNQGGLMWTKDGKIKVIDTDFFLKYEDIAEEKTYSHNLEHFNTMIEMETGFMEGPVYKYLSSKQEYFEIYNEYVRAAWTGKSMSVTVLFDKAVEVFTQEFGITPSNITEMETILKENNLFIQEEKETEIPVFEPPSIDEIPMFSEMDVGRKTIDVPVEQKEKAQGQVSRDEQELEQGNIIE